MPRRWWVLSNSPSKYRIREFTWMLCENLWFIISQDYWDIMVVLWKKSPSGDYESPQESAAITKREWKSPLPPEKCWRINRRLVAKEFIEELLTVDYKDKKGSRSDRLRKLYGSYITVIKWLWRIAPEEEPENFRSRIDMIDDILPHGMYEMYSELRENAKHPVNFLKNKVFKYGTTYSWLYCNRIEKMLQSPKITRFIESGEPDLTPELIGTVTENDDDLAEADLAQGFNIFESGADTQSEPQIQQNFQDAQMTHTQLGQLYKVSGKTLAEVREQLRSQAQLAKTKGEKKFWKNVVKALERGIDLGPGQNPNPGVAARQLLQKAATNKKARQDLQKNLVVFQQLLAKKMLLPDLAPEERETFIGEYLALENAILPHYHDLVAAADAIISNKAGPDTGMGLLTNSNWASLTGVFGALVSIAVLSRSWKEMSASERSLAVFETTTGVIGAGAQMTQFVLANFHGGKTLTSGQMEVGRNVTFSDGTSRAVTGVDMAATAMQLTGASVSIVSGLTDFATGVHEGASLSKIHARWAKAKKRWPGFAAALRENPTMVHFRKACYKIRRRKYRAGSKAATGAVKVGGGVIAILGTVGAVGATVSNPVGWCVAGVTLLGGIGLGVHSLVRGRRHKKQIVRYRKHIFKDAPAFCKTTGDYHRWKVATFVYSAVVGPPSWWKRNTHAQLLGWQMAWVLVGGDDMSVMQKEITQMGVQGLIAFMRG